MMLRKLTFAAAVAALSAVSAGSSADAADPYAATQLWAYNIAAQQPWHGSYYHIQYGTPLALVAPPTAHMRQTFSWGVSQNTNHPIYHQYGRSAPGYGFAPGSGFLPTPGWPSHTDQFGVYYVRGPW